MSQPKCPEHNCSELVPGGISRKTNKAYSAFYKCELKSCTAGRGGKPWTQDATPEIPTAPPVAAQAMTASQASPRLQAAYAALQAAATRFAGTQVTAGQVLDEAAQYYYWLKQTNTGDIPMPLADPTDDDVPSFR